MQGAGVFLGKIYKWTRRQIGKESRPKYCVYACTICFIMLAQEIYTPKCLMYNPGIVAWNLLSDLQLGQGPVLGPMYSRQYIFWRSVLQFTAESFPCAWAHVPSIATSPLVCWENSGLLYTIVHQNMNMPSARMILSVTYFQTNILVLVAAGWFSDSESNILGIFLFILQVETWGSLISWLGNKTLGVQRLQ